MDVIVKKILELENEAQQVLEEAKSKQNSLDKDIFDITAQIEKNITFEMNRKIGQIKELELQLADKKIEEIGQAKKLQLERIEKLASEKQEQWVTMLFSKIFGR